MNTIEALQKLYVAMGGEAEDVAKKNIIPEMIDAIADAYQGGGGGGSDLPDVTAEDNGDVLTVVDGAWNKAAAPKELPKVTSANDGQVLTVLQGKWQRGIAHDTVTVSYSWVEPDPEVDPEAEAHWECDVDVDTIINHYKAGRNVIAHVDKEINGVPISILVPLTAVSETEEINLVVFGLAAPSSTNVRELNVAYIQHSNVLGINVETGGGYLSATDPNT